MRQTMLRVFGSAVATAVVVGGLALTTAGPAQATAQQCYAYLTDHGYTAHPDTELDACYAGENGLGARCHAMLSLGLAIPAVYVNQACEWAAWK
ncbi:hypothetical protein [Kutzneria kofuensis]|uniref:Uncharacterized protein n=1 Tax=Kutzneria kofuensis TaxID=103725 RepID=A0A7W9NHH2_9PSEU|nr:hypothetical protein [Kutzneria kofuensis]MBB5892133.1 hypothetical protein [Kutzneria kofuensis]